MTLYELTTEWQGLIQAAEENQGIFDEDKLKQLTEVSSEKIDRALDALADLEAQEAAQRAQAQRMTKRAQSSARAAEVLRERILWAVQASGGKHASDRWKATLTTGRPAIVAKNDAINVHDLDQVNPDFVKTKIEKSLDLEALGKLADDELDLMGFKRIRKPFLRIS